MAYSNKQQGNDKDKSGPPKQDNEALEKYKDDELQSRWKEFVHRARVHEMLKCLKSEHQKLQALKDNINIDDVFRPEFTRKSEIGSEYKKSVGSVNNSSEANKKSVTNVLYSRNKPDDEESTSEIITQIKKNPSNKRDMMSMMSGTQESKTPIEVFKSKNVITDKEFEEILELCDDKIEQQTLREAFEEKKKREKYLHSADEKRKMLYDFINSNFFNQFMLVTIIISIVGIFFMTFEQVSNRWAYPLQILDSCIIAIFVVEAIFKITIYRGDYFTEPWNILDLLIIIVHLLEVSMELITRTLALSTDISNVIYFKFLKSLRAMRLIRIIKFLPNLQVVVVTIFQSMLSMGSIAVLMLLFIFVFAVMGRGLFFEVSPKHFGSMLFSFVTLFQLLTLDDWFDILKEARPSESRELNETNTVYWVMFMYLFCYIVIEYFVFLNLFVAVLVDNFQITLADAEVRKKKDALSLDSKHIFEDLKMEFDNDTEYMRSESDLNNPENQDLPVEDYFCVVKGSKEAKVMGEVFKDLNSLDFERFLWKRRFNLLNMVIDQALSSQVNTWSIQDAESLTVKRKTDNKEETENESHKGVESKKGSQITS